MNSLVFLATLALASCSPLEKVVSSDRRQRPPSPTAGASAPASPSSTLPATSRATAGPWTPPVPNGATSTPATAPPARTSPRQPGSPPTPGPTRLVPPPPSAPTSAQLLWPLPLLWCPPPSRSLPPMCPSSTTTITSTSLPPSLLPTTPSTRTLTGTRSHRVPTWHPSPRRQPSPTPPSQPSRGLSSHVLLGHFYQIKT